MKKSILITSSALTMILAVITTDGFSQRNNYPHGAYPPPAPVYQKQWDRPASPFVIVDGDGRRNSYQGRNFDQCFEQRSLSRKQRRKMERRFGFVPPLVIYVPERLVNRSGRGEFFTYNSGLIYQRQRDGFFHLDDRYLNNDFNDRDDRDNYRDNDNGRGRW